MTKGPWHLIEISPMTNLAPSMTYLANSTPHIHGIMRGVSPEDEQLIAAAPDMLEALISVRMAMAAGLDSEQMFNASIKVIQAIKKAGG